MYRVLLLGGLALALIIVNTYSGWLDPVRAKVGLLATPFYWITDLPNRVGVWADDVFASREKLQQENATLRAELLIHRRKLQQMASLAAENMRLRELMNSAEMIKERVLVAELIGVSPDPLAHKVIVSKGARHGVYLGQPLLDSSGLMGQVVAVSPYSSQVMLITDSTHALPVQVNRNGLRAVVEGIGDLYHLNLRHVSNTVDIRKGDLLISSGLGQRFPRGYPVAVVESVIHDPGKPFATVTARPKAQLNRSRHVLLVFSSQSAEMIAPTDPETGEQQP